MDDTAKLVPADGVYAVYVNVVDSKSSKINAQQVGMLNIGYRPTLNNGQERSIEVHILDFEGDLYGRTVMVEFAHYLRGERTFANIEELTEQLQKDKERVKQLLAKE